MRANYRGDHLMAEIVSRLGMCETVRHARIYEPRDDVAATSKLATGFQLLVRVLTKLAPRKILAGLRGRFGVAAGVDWNRTQAFVLPTDRNSYLRINLRGREPQGIVSPGEEYETLLRRIDEEFRSPVNIETREPAVEEVFFVHKLYPGPQTDELPDVAILWRGDAP
jgi:hypothetical protein